EMDGVSTFGVDFWHAVEFSRNGRFLCTHPLGLSSGLSFCSVLSFPTLSDSLGPDFLGAFQVLRFRAFPFPAIPTLPDHFRALLLESRSVAWI
ncbi:hypothetical protein NJL88_39985, partial [Streptomyces sp. DK15]|uniref:hypothetical protein n=1 Tax=Streptomyces sp. DK15 TaxID=2957499 RepID=UPI0029BA83F5